MESAVELKEVVKIYQTGSVPVKALDGISLSVEKGHFVSVIGKSGSGKSTLLHMMGTLDSPTSGKVYLDGIDITNLMHKELTLARRKIGYVFQKFQLMPEYTVWDNICMPVYLSHEKVDMEYIDHLAETLQITERLSFYPPQLSGGEQQRAAIARAMANRPELVLADEPTGNLDYNTGMEVMDALERSRKEFRQTIVMVTHDMEWAGRADRIITIKDGKIEEDMRTDSNTFDKNSR